MRVLLVILFVSTSAYSAETTPFHGVWGTEAQCSGSLIHPKGSKRAVPFDIRPDWISHGDIWCRLNWMSVRQNTAGAQADAHAICGEDDARDYRIRFHLEGDELTLTWNLWHVNGPLTICAH
ncbi:MAG: hypothetical protein KTR18_08490 [Acidiferrobacterales bacterium]|nr:hypothetical protein [Acidiferrobacterales bacterium]